VARCGDKLVGGLSGLEIGAIPSRTPYWFAFIEVDDVDARIALARPRGAEILQEPHDVPNVGRVAVIRDPTGAAVGLMTSAKPA
jgi:predicted enzyme related to lactoylglutathione lyase